MTAAMMHGRAVFADVTNLKVASQPYKLQCSTVQPTPTACTSPVPLQAIATSSVSPCVPFSLSLSAPSVGSAQVTGRLHAVPISSSMLRATSAGRRHTKSTPILPSLQVGSCVRDESSLLSPTARSIGVLGSAKIGARKMHDAVADPQPSFDSDAGCLAPKSARRTQFAALLEGLRYSPHNDLQIEAALADGVDGVLHRSHKESQQHFPNAEDLLTNLGSTQRESILEWLVQACDIMKLPDAVLYSTVLTLDRYCAVAHEPLPMERMQKVLMAVICTVLKTCAIADEVTMPLRELLLHLCRRQVVFEEILEMEHRVLQTLRFCGITAPTALDFLETLGMPLHLSSDSAESCVPLRLAKFLVELSLFNVSVHYRHPHAILAAASLYVALCSCRCSPVTVPALLQDVEAVCLEISDVQTAVVTCATELHSLWHEFAALQGNRVQCLLRKFSGSRLHAAILLNPPAALVPTTTASSDTSQRLRRSTMPSMYTASHETSRASSGLSGHSPPLGLNRWAGSHTAPIGCAQRSQQSMVTEAVGESDSAAVIEAAQPNTARVVLSRTAW